MYKLNKTILSFILSIFAATIANAQCLPPPPIVENVTVMPNNTDITVKWHENPDNTCITTGYEIYKYNYATGQFDLLSLAPAGITAILDINAEGNIRPQIYRMTTKAGAAGNEHSENHHTMFLYPVMQYNTCYLTAALSWRPYKTSYRDGFEIRPSEKKFNDSVKYQIVGYIAPPSSPFNIASAAPLSEITSDTTVSFSMLVNQNYLFCVKAFLPNGSTSYSNIREGMLSGSNIPNAPMYINLDSIVSFDTHNHLHFEIDNSTQMTKFQVERTTNLDSAFKIIHTFSDKTITAYDDNTCDVNIKYFYRITAFNNASACDNIPAKISDTLNSIIVGLKYIKPDVNISWSELTDNANYMLYRNGTFWNYQYGDTHFIDMSVQNDYSNNIYDFCYKIVATDITNQNTSISREYCIALDKHVTMPNAIDPTDPLTFNTETYRQRNQFAPIIGGKNTDYEYYMIIFDRWNNIVFETTKPMDVPLTNEYMWNGTSLKGYILPEDTYLYYVKVTFKNSKQLFEQRGSVSIIYQ
jgi:hypothetical protein